MFDLTIRIIERNQNEQAHTYTATQGIDEAFENLAAEMPSDWWDVPKDIPQDRSPTAVQLFDRLMFQIIYFQFVALLHLPFMLRAAKERRYEYSKFSCMKSSREMINRYLALRHNAIGTFCCRITDFGAFTATVTIFLGLLEPSSSGDSRDKQQRDSDRNLVEMVLKSMEEIRRPGKDLVAKQSASAIRSLLAITSPSGLCTTILKLSIPYFGTISIVRPPVAPPCIETESFPSSRPAEEAAAADREVTRRRRDDSRLELDAPPNTPLISFTSSQFSSVLPEQFSVEGWEIPGADTMFFDSLLNQDLTMMNLPPHQAHEINEWWDGKGI
jgi:hypothetical protein